MEALLRPGPGVQTDTPTEGKGKVTATPDPLAPSYRPLSSLFLGFLRIFAAVRIPGFSAS